MKRKFSLKELALEMPVLSNSEQSSIVGGSVKISVNRLGYGENSTLSAWQATAYDVLGNAVSTISGYFLEPGCDYDNCTTSGSDTAIAPGTYDVLASTYNGHYGYYEISNVEGRYGIKIHSGNTGADTLGCLLPGSSYEYDPATDEYSVTGSRVKLSEFNNFLGQYSSGGVKIDISY